MIVEPDFLDHWKTRMLARLLKDERAPIYVIRLWAHCQQRKTDRFTGWNPDVLASVCRWDSDGSTLWDAMGKTFLEIDGEDVVVHGWADTNASLISAWENGKRGGRPKAVKAECLKPVGNLPVNPAETSRVSDREEKIEKTTPKAPKGAEQVGFDEFWNAYPKKVAKPAAIKAWAKINPNDETFRKILESVKTQAASPDWIKDAGQFIPHPATYLNGRRWEDMFEAPETKETLEAKLRAHRGCPSHINRVNATAEDLAEYTEMLKRYKAMP